MLKVCLRKNWSFYSIKYSKDSATGPIEEARINYMKVISVKLEILLITDPIRRYICLKTYRAKKSSLITKLSRLHNRINRTTSRTAFCFRSWECCVCLSSICHLHFLFISQRPIISNWCIAPIIYKLLLFFNIVYGTVGSCSRYCY